jgi:hypothetical protein
MTRVIPLTTLAIAVVMTTTAQAATVLITGTTRGLGPESYRIGPEQRRRDDLTPDRRDSSALGDYTRRNGVSLRAGDLITLIADVLPAPFGTRKPKASGRPDAW